MLSMENYLTVLPTIIIIFELIMADDIHIKWSPDTKDVCEVNMDDTQLRCPISKEGKLPFLTSGDENEQDKTWEMVTIKCQPSSIDVFNINLTSSVFGKKFRAKHYVFDFEHCNLKLSPDLFDNVVPNVNSKVKYSLTVDMSDKSYIPNLSFNKASTDISIKHYGGDMDTLKTALENTKAIKLKLDFRLLTIPARFFTDISGLSDIRVTHTRLCESRAFWRLPDLAKLVIYVDVLMSKSFHKIGHIDQLYLYGPLTSLHNGSLHSISSITDLYLIANHDAFEGQTFHNVTSIDNLDLSLYPHLGPNCTRTSAECHVKFDFGGTKINNMSITMKNVLFVLPSSDIFSTLQLSQLSIAIRMIEKYPTDQWVDGSFIQGAIKGVSTVLLSVGNASEMKINYITCFPLNLTNSILKTITYKIERGLRNPICDSSWLTLPNTTDSLIFQYYAKMEHIPYPLIIRSPELARSVRLIISEDGPSLGFVHCTCSVAWLKQLTDCGAVHLDNMWLDLPCSFDSSMTLKQFLNSNICCNSTDPPTLNNEPNMPMKCNQFLPIPPELLYFNHADLPQCRNSSAGYVWEFNPCNVSDFYTKYILDKAQSEIGSSGNEANPVTNATNNSVTKAANNSVANATNNSVTNATNYSVLVMVLLIICAIVCPLCNCVICLCWWKRSFLQTQHNHFIAWRSNLVILDNEKMQYVNAINNNFDAVASVINLEKMIKHGRNKMTMDDCGEQIPLIAGNDLNDINELDHSDQVIQFLEKIETKSVVVIRWFLIQLIRDGHTNIVERIVDGVKSKKIDPEENAVNGVELNCL